jgi:hypothetical protein
MNKKLLVGIVVCALLIALGNYFFVTQNKSGIKSGKIYHIGILSGFDKSIVIGDSFKAEMAKLGYVENKNVFYDFQKTNFEPDKEVQILRKFVFARTKLLGRKHA